METELVTEIATVAVVVGLRARTTTAKTSWLQSLYAWSKPILSISKGWFV